MLFKNDDELPDIPFYSGTGDVASLNYDEDNARMPYMTMKDISNLKKDSSVDGCEDVGINTGGLLSRVE